MSFILYFVSCLIRTYISDFQCEFNLPSFHATGAPGGREGGKASAELRKGGGAGGDKNVIVSVGGNRSKTERDRERERIRRG